MPRLNIRSAWLGACSLITVVAALVSPPLQAQSPSAGQGGKLHLFFWQAPGTVNPHLSSARQDLSASRIVYEPLASFDGEGRLMPFLAEEIPSRENGGLAKDGRAVTWRLKRGLKWADGTPFTAADVVFTHDYITYSPVAAGSVAAYDEVWGVEALDDHRVRVTFKTPQANWTKPFVGATGMILPRHIFAAHIGAVAPQAAANRLALGTGPYRVVSFQEEDVLVVGDEVVDTIKIIYEPNPHFREQGKPSFSVVELQAGGEDAKIAAKAARDGLTDFAWNLAGDELALKILGGGTGQAVAKSNSWVEGLTVVLGRGQGGEEGATAAQPLAGPRQHLADWRLRQALAHGIDQEAIVALYRAAGLQNASSPAWTHGGLDGEALSAFDLKRARALLTEAGWVDSDGDGRRDKNGRPLALAFPSPRDPLRREVAQVIAASFRALGVEVGPENLDASAFFGPLSVNGIRRTGPFPWPALITKLDDGNVFRKADFTRHAEAGPAVDGNGGEVAVYPLIQLRQAAGVSKTLAGVALTPWDLPLWNIKDWRRRLPED